jgi:hypothetical protein
MKRVIIKRIGTASLVKWHLVYSLIAGLVAGIVYAAGGYLYTRQNPWTYVLWYGLGMPLIYLIVGLAVSIGSSLLFNSLSDSSGGLVLEVDVIEDTDPPPPPRFNDEHI